jgi:hypothetical protein
MSSNIKYLVCLMLFSSVVSVETTVGMDSKMLEEITPVQLQSVAETQTLVQTLQSENLKLTNHVVDLQSLVRDVIVGLEDARDAVTVQSIKTLYDILINKIKEEFQKAEVPYN